jgi:hypothetical protein
MNGQSAARILIDNYAKTGNPNSIPPILQYIKEAEEANDMLAEHIGDCCGCDPDGHGVDKDCAARSRMVSAARAVEGQS